MVTFASQNIYHWVLQHAPVPIVDAVLESGGSSDKKSSFASLSSVRGRKAIANCRIPAKVLERVLKTTAARLVEHRMRGLAVHAMIGAHGSSSHAANALAALYIALGQDPACVAESHAAMLRMRELPGGALQASITLPSVLVGTVGGGTALPSQRACMQLLGIADGGQPGSARALAEICAVTALAGELSIAAAFITDTFADAHFQLSRTGEMKRRAKL